MKPARKTDVLIGVMGLLGLGMLLYIARIERQVRELEARLVVAEQALEAPAATRAGHAGAAGTKKKKRKARQARLRQREGSGGAEDAAGAPDAGATAIEADALDPAGPTDADAAERHEAMLDAVEDFLDEAALPDDVADAVRALYARTFDASAAIRASVRRGELTRKEARAAQQELRQEARVTLEGLLEPEELDTLRDRVREAGGGGL
jgi:hypothetical protein